MMSLDHLALFLWQVFQAAFTYASGILFAFAFALGVVWSFRRVMEKS